MDVLRRTAAICAADLRERLRSARLWIVLALIAAAMWWSAPPYEADYLTVALGDGERGRYSSAWLGMVVALVSTTLLSLAGFYVVRGTVTRDLQTRVWQLLVATPMTRAGYLVAKWLSHLAVFALLCALMLAVAVALQMVRAEDRSLDVIELLKPTVLLALPSLALSATLAVWFDLVPWLRRTGGNVLFFFVWLIALAAGAQGAQSQGGPLAGLYDPSGITVAERSLRREAALTGPFSLSIGSQPLNGERPRRFEWRQWQVGAEDVAVRGAWVAFSLALLLAATPLLDRFAAHHTTRRTRHAGGRTLRWLDLALVPLQRRRTGGILAAELKLTLRQRRWRWWLLLAGVLVAQAAANDKGMAIAVIGGWLLMLDVVARQGLRERDTRTGALVLASPGILWRLLAARLLAGVALAWVATLPAMLRLSIMQPAAAATTALAGVSIAVWGLACAALCRNARPFELALVLLAYVSTQGALVLDVIRAPATTALWHAALLPAGVALLALGWPRLQRAA